MRTTVWVVGVALASVSCPTPLLGQEISKAVLAASKAGVSAGRMRMLTVPTGEFPCKGPGAGALPYVKCTDVPVIVLKDPAAKGECVVIVPYKSIVAYTKKATTQVTWNLIAPDGYTFDKKAGVAIPNAPNTYMDKGTSKQDTQYKWEIAQDAPKVDPPVDHVVNVNGPKGACEQGDPTMTNDPN